MAALHHGEVVREGAPRPERWVLFLHGIFGSGANWRTFARRWVEARPGWGALLVDLRMHGASQDLPGPHTVAAAAADLVELERTLARPIDAVVGHSFGGKVALELVRAKAGDLAGAFILDSTPGPRPDRRGSETTLQVLELLEQTGPVPSRNAFIDRVVAAGQSRELAQWLAMNLERRGEQFVLRLDLIAIRALLEDYFRIDLWPVLESPPGRAHLDVVLGGRSRVFDASERARLAALAARMPDRIAVHELPGAGHWVHVDDPSGVERILTSAALG